MGPTFGNIRTLRGVSRPPKPPLMCAPVYMLYVLSEVNIVSLHNIIIKLTKIYKTTFELKNIVDISNMQEKASYIRDWII